MHAEIPLYPHRPVIIRYLLRRLMAGIKKSKKDEQKGLTIGKKSGILTKLFRTAVFQKQVLPKDFEKS